MSEESRRTWFFAGVFASMASALTPLFTTSSFGMAAPLICMGVTLVAFPFAADLTVERNGVAGSRKLIRVVGALLLAMGAAFAVLGVLELR